MTKYIFLDTNVFLHCKTFTEINWRKLFEETQRTDEIFIVVPYMVNKELDSLKGSEKKARNLQKKLRELKDVEFEEGITLNITLFPTKWSILKPEWAEKLDENDSDCHIIAEVLAFKEKHPDDEIYFITGDNSPYFQANALGINTIFWLDDKYTTIFKPVEKRKEKKFTDLKIYFKNDDNKYEISPEDELSLEELIAEEFPDFTNIMDNEEKKTIISNDDQDRKILEKITIKDAKEKGLIVDDLIKSLGPNAMFSLLASNLKSRKQFKEEVLKYYEEMKEYRKYIEIELFLNNRGNKPYNNVNIEIFTVLEKEFELKSKEELEMPEKPKRERSFFPFIKYPSILSTQHREYNVKYSSPQKIEKNKNDIWVFGYSVRKIQHNDTLQLYPIMIKFPEVFKMKKIQLHCTFLHDEEGATKDQKLEIDIS